MIQRKTNVETDNSNTSEDQDLYPLSSSAEESMVLRGRKNDLNDTMTTNNENMITSARKLLQNWKIIYGRKLKKFRPPKRDKVRSNIRNNINKGAGFIIAQPTTVVINKNGNLVEISTTVIQSTEDVDDLINSGICTLGSLSKNKGRQDFHTTDDEDSCWKLDEINVTCALYSCAISKMTLREQLLVMNSVCSIHATIQCLNIIFRIEPNVTIRSVTP
ncbi:hypothetical protein AB4K20DRAFT_1985646 [Rhizopus microsporus]|uniref:Uncharacterized protein n=1 Tax=Rhizopus microsporus TaxID=58291 RepID=A0A1X0RZC2_RHIZD|nr:hypothetical protein BCV71DRAFT_235897 [Rhizopus microsporus]